MNGRVTAFGDDGNFSPTLADGIFILALSSLNFLFSHPESSRTTGVNRQDFCSSSFEETTVFPYLKPAAKTFLHQHHQRYALLLTFIALTLDLSLLFPQLYLFLTAHTPPHPYPLLSSFALHTNHILKPSSTSCEIKINASILRSKLQREARSLANTNITFVNHSSPHHLQAFHELSQLSSLPDKATSITSLGHGH